MAVWVPASVFDIYVCRLGYEIYQNLRQLGSRSRKNAALRGPFLIADMVRVNGNEMGDLRGTVYMKTIDRILNQSIGVGDALMLA